MREDELFLSLLKKEQGKLYRIAWAILGNAADAADALSETVVSAYRAFPNLRGGPAAFSGWIRRILVNVASTMLRRRRRVIPVGEPGILEGHAVAPGPESSGSEVWEAVSRLDDRHRPIVVLRFVNDMSLDDIAHSLDLPLGTVKSRLHHAIRILRGMLREDEGEGRLRRA